MRMISAIQLALIATDCGLENTGAEHEDNRKCPITCFQSHLRRSSFRVISIQVISCKSGMSKWFT